MAYGQALKDRVLRLYDQGKQTGEIAQQLDVIRSWARRAKQRRNQPPRKIGGGRFKLDEAKRSVLAGWIKEQPDATLAELQRRCFKHRWFPSASDPLEYTAADEALAKKNH